MKSGWGYRSIITCYEMKLNDGMWGFIYYYFCIWVKISYKKRLAEVGKKKKITKPPPM